MSASTRRARRPSWASVIAKFVAVMDLPSLGSALVKTSVVGGRSGLANMMLVRSPRYASDAQHSGSRPATRWSPIRWVLRGRLADRPLGPRSNRIRGTTLITVTPPLALRRSSPVWTLSSKRSLMKATPTPAISPSTSPSDRLSSPRGLRGSSGRTGTAQNMNATTPPATIPVTAAMRSQFRTRRFQNSLRLIPSSGWEPLIGGGDWSMLF